MTAIGNILPGLGDENSAGSGRVQGRAGLRDHSAPGGGFPALPRRRCRIILAGPRQPTDPAVS